MIHVERFDANKDAVAVGDLLRTQAMRFAGFELFYNRGENFTRLLELQAPFSQTYLLKKDSELGAIISLSSSYRWCEGALRPVCMLSDLRTNGSPWARQAWRSFGPEVLADFSQRFHPAEDIRFFALILAGNTAARKAFVASSGLGPLGVTEVGQLAMANVFAGPFFGADSDMRSATAADQNELFDFLNKESQKKYLGYNYTEQFQNEWQRRQKEWGVHLEDFLILRESGRIKACALPWMAPASVKSMTLAKAPKAFEFGLGGLQKFGVNVPTIHQEIKTLYLTHLHIADDMVPGSALLRLIQAAKKQKADVQAQMISFADNWNCLNQSPLRGKVLAMKVGVVLGQIGRREATKAQSIDVEMATL